MLDRILEKRLAEIEHIRKDVKYNHTDKDSIEFEYYVTLLCIKIIKPFYAYANKDYSAKVIKKYLDKLKDE